MKRQYEFVATAVVAFLLFGIHYTVAAEGVDINTASAEKLDAIVGIGPTLAQRIIEARPFSSLDDLLRVKGIGEKTLQKIKDQGLAFVDEQVAVKNEELLNEEKSDTKMSVATSAIKEPLPNNNSSFYQNPKVLFLIVLGFVLITGAVFIIWKSKNHTS